MSNISNEQPLPAYPSFGMDAPAKKKSSNKGAFIFAIVVVAIFLIGKAIFGGDDSPSSSSSGVSTVDAQEAAMSMVWKDMSRSEQGDLCSYWNIDSHDAYRILANGWGDGAPSYATVSTFFNSKC